MRVNRFDQFPNPCPSRAPIPRELRTLVPIKRAEVACLGDRIVQRFAPAGLIVGPIRFIIGLAVALFAAIGAGLAKVLGKDKVCADLSFVARRGIDESARGFYEALVFLISSRDFTRDAKEQQGYIRDGEAYGNFMYKGPEGSIAYSKESVSAGVNWDRVRNESWEWRGYASRIGFAARARDSVENRRVHVANRFSLPEISI